MFLKLKKNNNIIGLEEANYIYRVLCRHRDISQTRFQNYILKDKLYLLSNIFERDAKAFETCNLNTAFLIGRFDFLVSIEVLHCFNKSQRLAYDIGLFFRLKNISNLINIIINILFSFIKWLFLFIFSLLDSVSIVFYSLFSTFCNNFLRLFNSAKNKFHHIQEIYTIFYWKKNAIDSSLYYYPDYYSRKSKISFILDFVEFRFLISGILNSCKHNYLITAIDFLGFKEIYLAIRDLFKLYFIDLSQLNFLSYSEIVRVFFTLRIINKRLYALLNYHAIPKIIDRLHPKSIYIWSENQFSQRAVNVSISKLLSSNSDLDLKVYSNIGSFFSNKYLPHRVPTKIELRNGVWGTNNFILQDSISLNEIELILKKRKIDYKIQVARNGLRRFKEISNIDKTIFFKRYYTYFTEGNPLEIYQVLFRFCNQSKFKCENTFTPDIYIRLHPLISIQAANYYINKFKKASNIKSINIYFINTNSESIIESMLFSKICIFSQSSYINQALSLGLNVIAVRSSYLYHPPIQNHFSNIRLENVI